MESEKAAISFWKEIQKSIPILSKGKLVGELKLDDFIVKSPNPTFKRIKIPENIQPNKFLRTTIIIWEPTIFWSFACKQIPCPYCHENKQTYQFSV